MTVLEGSEAVLRCEVQNPGGQVQWTKDGFALGKYYKTLCELAIYNSPSPSLSPSGYSAVIPGFPRFSVLGDRNHGVYNLKISNVSIDDDAEFQCQVGPAKQHSAIRASARLTVIVK